MTSKLISCPLYSADILLMVGTLPGTREVIQKHFGRNFVTEMEDRAWFEGVLTTAGRACGGEHPKKREWSVSLVFINETAKFPKLIMIHEATHVVFDLFRQLGIKLEGGGEEAFTRMVEWLIGEMWK